MNVIITVLCLGSFVVFIIQISELTKLLKELKDSVDKLCLINEINDTMENLRKRLVEIEIDLKGGGKGNEIGEGPVPEPDTNDDP